jgi:hypothetical protein
VSGRGVGAVSRDRNHYKVSFANQGTALWQDGNATAKQRKTMEKLTGKDVLRNEVLAIDWRKQVSYFLYVAANHDTDTTEFQEALEHLQAKHDEWIFNNGN